MQNRITEFGEEAVLRHFTGGQTWGGPYGQTPTRAYGDSTIWIRAQPIREELIINEQSFEAGDLEAWVNDLVVVAVKDLITFGPDSRFEGTWKVAMLERQNVETKLYLKEQSG